MTTSSSDQLAGGRRPAGGLKAPVRHKWISPSWMEEQLAGLKPQSVYEPFAGRARLGHYFKRRGLRVVTGDLLESHYVFQLALIENNRQIVPLQQAHAWLALIKDPMVATRFSPWANQHFTPEEAIWLGIWNAHLSQPDLDPVVRALGAAAVGLTMDYWLSFNQRDQAQKPMAPTVAFQHYLQTIHSWVCNNGQTNQALWGDAYHLAPRVEADLMVCYPPTDQGFLDYPEHHHLFECWVKGDPHLALPGVEEPSHGPPTLGVPQDDPQAYTEALRRFLERVTHIPLWALAFHDRYPLDEAAFTAVVKEFRPVLRRSALSVSTGERGAAPGERLILAQAK
ncbi:MAG: hypothetical protein ACK46X_00025 [Candidatus Sericytochromatia bacterium]